MAEFGTQATQLSAPSGAGANPIQGVMTPTSNVTLPTGLLQIGTQVVADIRKGEVAKTKADAEAAKNNVITRYVSEITKINTAGRDAGWSPSEISARTRAVGNQYAVEAASMGIIEDLDKARKAALNIGEVGDTISEAEEARTQRVKDVDKLRTLGVYAPPDAPPEYIQQQLERSLGREFYESEWAQKQREIDAGRQNLTFTQTQADRAKKEATAGFLSKYAANNFESVSASISQIGDKVLAGGLSADEGRVMINASASEANAVLAQMTIANPEMATPLKQLFNDLHKNQLDRLENPSKDLENQYKTLINKAKLIAVQDNPELIGLIVANDTLGQTITGTLTASNVASKVIPKMMSMDTRSGNLVTNLVGDGGQKTAENEMYSQANQVINLLKTGTANDPVAAKATANLYINNILDQLGDKYGSNKIKATDLKEITGFMNGPNFAYFVKEGGLDPSTAAQAKKAYQQLYAKEVDGSIKSQLEAPIPVGTREGALARGAQARGEAPETQPETIMSAVDIGFSNGSVQFTPKTTAEFSSSSKKAIVTEKIRDLRNTQTALTQLVRIGAHLEGTTNYQEYWEKNKATILPYYYGNESYPIGVVVDGWKLNAYPYSDRRNWERVDGGE